MLKRIILAAAGIATYSVGIHNGSPEFFIAGLAVFLLSAMSLASRVAR